MRLRKFLRWASIAIVGATLAAAPLVLLGLFLGVPARSLSEPTVVLAAIGAIFGHLLLVARERDVKAGRREFPRMLATLVAYPALLLVTATFYGVRFGLLPRDMYIYMPLGLLSLLVIGFLIYQRSRSSQTR